MPEVEPDYTAMQPGDMLAAVGDDAYKWATAFMQFTAKYPLPIEHADMIGWFANAIESSHALRMRKITQTS